MGSVTKYIREEHYILIISTHTLRGERDVGADMILQIHDDFNSHAPWGAWRIEYVPFGFKYTFQLTRSVGSVTATLEIVSLYE